jgi:hypothetical protein
LISSNLPEIKNLEISVSSLLHAISILSKNNQISSSGKVSKLPEDANEFEKRVMSEVISPEELNVHFEDIGALENVKGKKKKILFFIFIFYFIFLF